MRTLALMITLSAAPTQRQSDLETRVVDLERKVRALEYQQSMANDETEALQKQLTRLTSRVLDLEAK